ncbi:rho GTPase-activating protein 7 [Aplysia californica]|uniref:Rho GTPase-activating protein 7 n=1 Tax=Aplysia californica TaxID=6500 RepID=A0ABM1AEK3_APLCA|nr:rho GTPase-activating protein 7 [Aplysia californica]
MQGQGRLGNVRQGQGQGCIALTRPLKVAAPPKLSVRAVQPTSLSAQTVVPVTRHTQSQQNSNQTASNVQKQQQQQQQPPVSSPISPRLRRVASERIKTAKNLWRKMEGGLKPKKSRRSQQRREILDISGPVLADKGGDIQAKLQRLHCVDISPTAELAPSPVLTSALREGQGQGRGHVGVEGRLSSSEGPVSPTSPDTSATSPLPPTSPLVNSPRLSDVTDSSAASSAKLSEDARVVAPSSCQGDSLSTSSSASTITQESTLRARLTPAEGDPQRDGESPSSPVTDPPTSALSHDSSFDEYYNAQSQLQQTFESAQNGGRGVSKNKSDTNLMEIFLLPQDHQPGSFPRMLQNGYIETEASGMAVNARTGSVRLGRNTGAYADHNRLQAPRAGQSASSSSSSPSAAVVSPRLGGNRVSVYDNFAPADGSRSAPVSGVVESGQVRDPRGKVDYSRGSLASPSAIGSQKNRNGKSVSFDSAPSASDNRLGQITETNASPESPSSSSSSPSSSIRETSQSFRNQNVSFEPSPTRTLEDSKSGGKNTNVTTGSEINRITESSDTAASSGDSPRGVVHSASVDSYFTEGGEGRGGVAPSVVRSHTDSNNSNNSNNACSSALQQEYAEFDQILQQLYDNIEDLNRCMGSGDKDDRSGVSSRMASVQSPSPDRLTTVPPTATTTTTMVTMVTTVDSPLYIDAPHSSSLSSSKTHRTHRPVFDLDSPTSPTSDLVMSPASPLSPSGVDESMDLDGATDPENENSSSGGEGSNTAESASDDQEVALTDVSHDDSLDQIPEVSRERRDSGMGHSLKRAHSEGRRKKIRWHSFQRCHRPDVTSRAMQINSLTIGQLVRLQKLSLLKLTSIMEKCLPVNKSGWNWMMPRFMKRHKSPDFSDKNVFGIPLSVMAQRTGQPLPQCVLYAMRYLRRTAQRSVGIFRKSGVKSKIQQLRDHLESHPDTTDFEGINAYNVADMLKTYFRDLPECLLTSKLSETFRSIYTHVPLDKRFEAIQAAILLLPDENREVLQSLLLFLWDIATHESEHQMNASNLAVCFTPTVFMLGSRQAATHSPKRNRKNSPGMPDPREILEQKAAHECLTMMIQDSKKLFTVPFNLFRQLQVHSLAHMEPAPLQDLCGDDPASEVRAFGQERIQMVLKEAHDKNKGWMQCSPIADIEVSHRKPLDDCPLKEWKLVVDIEAPPIEVLRRIMHERHAWDEDLLSWSVVERMDPHSDIFQYVLNSMAPHPSRHYCVLRYWRSDLTKGACALITMSVEHADAMEVQGVRAVDLGSYFLMEPCGSGRSRLTYITRVDSRGRTPEWYSKIFGHISANFLDRLRESFKQEATSGPETKV